MPEQIHFQDVCKMCGFSSVLYVAAWFRTSCEDDPSTTKRQVSKCRLLAGTGDAQSFPPGSEELYPSRAATPVRPPMIQFVRLERGVKIRSFRKNIQSSS